MILTAVLDALSDQTKTQENNNNDREKHINPYPANVENNASRWPMGFSSAFKRLKTLSHYLNHKNHFNLWHYLSPNVAAFRFKSNLQERLIKLNLGQLPSRITTRKINKKYSHIYQSWKGHNLQHQPLHVKVPDVTGKLSNKLVNTMACALAIL